MSIVAKIKSIDPLYIQNSNTTVLDVAVEFVDGKKVVGTKQVEFAVGTPEADIRKEVAGYAFEFETEQVRRVKEDKVAKERDTVDKETSTLRKNLVGKDIEAKANVVKSKS